MMKKDLPGKVNNYRSSWHSMSIQQRLPILICVLLLAVIMSFGIASYYTVRRALIEVGKERLKTLTGELGSMFSLSTGNVVNTLKKSADDDTLRQYLGSGTKELREEALQKLKKLHTDSTVVLVELLGTDFKRLLSYSEAGDSLQQKIIQKNQAALSPPEPDRLGNMYPINGSVYLPAIAAVHAKNKVIGYLVNWRLLVTSPQAIQQVSALMGKGAALYVGNRDGKIWTDLQKPVPSPPVNTKNFNNYFFEYDNGKGNNVVAALQPIANTDWLVLVEFSKEVMLEGATRFVYWLTIIGSLLIITGMSIAWFMSRNITTPLNQLTRGAMAIAQGDYTQRAQLDRRDELGKLSDAFNTMQKEVQATHLHLEQRIKERTIQLESVNRELEAFSYSVSHDLRAPLRRILSYAQIFEEQHDDKLDQQGRRVIGVIKSNTVKMNELIDALLDFFRMSTQDLVKRDINTGQLVRDAIKDLEDMDHPVTWKIPALPDMYGDPSAMRQVWINLLSNAVKYSRKVASPLIELGSFSENGQQVFFVKDNGAGFDAKYGNKLFKVFQRLHNASEFEGTGIGLAIVEKIISKHGGNVYFEAEVDKGACFYFTLPVK